jgi:hypothetical protein
MNYYGSLIDDGIKEIRRRQGDLPDAQKKSAEQKSVRHM